MSGLLAFIFLFSLMEVEMEDSFSADLLILIISFHVYSWTMYKLVENFLG